MIDIQKVKNVKAAKGVQTALRSAWHQVRTQPRVAAASALALALIAGWMVHSFNRTDAAQYTYYPVKRNDFLVSIIEGGTLKAVHEVTVRSELEGVARIISIVPEGLNVHQGDLLVELDSSDLRERLSAQEVTFQNAQFAFGQAEEQLRLLTKYDLPKRKRALEPAVEQADKELERLKLRSASQIAQVEASLKSQSATLELQEKRLNELKQQLDLTRIYAPQDGL